MTRPEIARERVIGAHTVLESVADGGADSIRRAMDDNGRRLGDLRTLFETSNERPAAEWAELHRAAGALLALRKLIDSGGDAAAAAKIMAKLFGTLADRLRNGEDQASAVRVVDNAGLMQTSFEISDGMATAMHAGVAHAYKRERVAERYRAIAAAQTPPPEEMASALTALLDAVATLPRTDRAGAHRALCEIARAAGHDTFRLESAILLACPDDEVHTAADARRARIVVADLGVDDEHALRDIVVKALFSAGNPPDASIHAGLRSLAVGVRHERLRATLINLMAQSLPADNEAAVFEELFAAASGLKEDFARIWSLHRLGIFAQQPVRDTALTAARSAFARETNAESIASVFHFELPTKTDVSDPTALLDLRRRYFLRAVDIADAITSPDAKFAAFAALTASAPDGMHAEALERVIDRIERLGKPDQVLHMLIALLFEAKPGYLDKTAAAVTKTITAMGGSITAKDALRCFGKIAKLNAAAEAHADIEPSEREYISSRVHQHLRTAAGAVADPEARATAVVALAARPPAAEPEFAFGHARALLLGIDAPAARIRGLLLLASSLRIGTLDRDLMAYHLAILKRDLGRETDHGALVAGFTEVAKLQDPPVGTRFYRTLLLHLANAVGPESTRTAACGIIVGGRHLPRRMEARERRSFEALNAAIAAEPPLD